MNSSQKDRKRKARQSFLVPAVFVAVQVAILAIALGGLEVTNLVRAYVAGEGHYSKGQKGAVHALGEFVRSGNPGDWSTYQWQIKIPRGGRLAREALESSPPDEKAAYRGLIQNFNHPDDVPGMIWLFRNFSDSRLMRDQIEIWRHADRNIQRIEALAWQIKGEMDGARDPQRLDSLLSRIDHLDAELTVYEHAFSASMRRAAEELHTMVYWAGGGASLLLWAGALWVWGRNARQAARASDLLMDSERRFRDVAETAGDWIWETDAQFRITFLSERLEEVIGVSREAFLGKSRLEISGADKDDPKWAAHLADLRAQRPFRDFEYVFPAPDGRALHFLISGRPVYDANGVFIGYRGTGRDVTREVEAHRRIAEQHKVLQATLDNMNQGISVTDGGLCLIAYNKRFLKLLDFPEDRFELGDHFEKFVRYNAERGEYGEGDPEDLVQERLNLARRFEPHSFTRRRPDGKVILIEGAPMPGGGFVTVYTDITEQENTKLELSTALATAEQADRAKSQFLANMSHELRTPLNAIIGFSDLMREEMLGPLGTPAYREYLEDISASGAHLLSLIGDILDLSRIEAGHVDLEEEEVDLAGVIGDALRLLAQEAKAAEVDLETTVPEGLVSVLGDRKRLRQIVVNLAGNAIKFSPNAGKVTLRARNLPSGDLQFEVVDRGPGIAEADIPTILEPFRQVEATIASNHNGTGLGLPLVKRLAELHGGELIIQSEVGKGTCAAVRFPASRICSASGSGRAMTG